MTPGVWLLVLAVAWALAGSAGARRRRHAVRRRARATTSTESTPTNPPTAASTAALRSDPLLVVGASLARLVPGDRRPADAVLRRLVATVPLAVVTAVAVGPLPAAVLAATLVVPPVVRGRRRPGAERAAAVAGLPDVVDLLAVAARAGLAAPVAVAHVAERAPPPWGPALRAVGTRTSRGDRFVDAVDELAGVGGAASGVGDPLRAVLRAAAGDGADLVGALDRLAADARDLRRRRAEEAARRVPVRLLLPLVACSLPAFALLTIVPIVVGALRDLDL